jgi:hypothetical protein
MLNELNKKKSISFGMEKQKKIKRNMLIGDIQEGRLKMIHLQSFIIYLKISWIK